MPTAYIKYRSGGGFQQVTDYDYVFDSRKYLDNGFYRDSGFPPMVLPPESTAIDAGNFNASGVQIGTGTSAQYDAGTIARLSILATTTFNAKQPDEVTHTAPRQLSYYDTTLTFCADSDTSVTFAADHTTDTMTAIAHGLGGKRFVISAAAALPAVAALPAGLLENTLYYPVNITADTFQLALSQNGPVVNFTSNGTGTLTAMVVDTIAEFPWRDIMGWSNTEPTR